MDGRHIKDKKQPIQIIIQHKGKTLSQHDGRHSLSNGYKRFTVCPHGGSSVTPMRRTELVAFWTEK